MRLLAVHRLFEQFRRSKKSSPWREVTYASSELLAITSKSAKRVLERVTSTRWLCKCQDAIDHWLCITSMILGQRVSSRCLTSFHVSSHNACRTHSVASKRPSLSSVPELYASSFVLSEKEHWILRDAKTFHQTFSKPKNMFYQWFIFRHISYISDAYVQDNCLYLNFYLKCNNLLAILKQVHCILKVACMSLCTRITSIHHRTTLKIYKVAVNNAGPTTTPRRRPYLKRIL